MQSDWPQTGLRPVNFLHCEGACKTTWETKIGCQPGGWVLSCCHLPVTLGKAPHLTWLQYPQFWSERLEGMFPLALGLLWYSCAQLVQMQVENHPLPSAQTLGVMWFKQFVDYHLSYEVVWISLEREVFRTFTLIYYLQMTFFPYSSVLIFVVTIKAWL
jgi:hypothetical protein